MTADPAIAALTRTHACAMAISQRVIKRINFSQYGLTAERRQAERFLKLQEVYIDCVQQELARRKARAAFGPAGSAKRTSDQLQGARA